MIGSARISPVVVKYIEKHLASEPLSPERLMSRISHVLAVVSHNVGLVLGPALEEKVLEHVKFVKLPDQRILAVIVSKPDLVENRIIRLEDEISQRELDRTADSLNAEFRGWSLGTIRLEIFKRLEEMKHMVDRLLSNVAKLLMWGALAEEAASPLFVEGTARLLELFGSVSDGRSDQGRDHPVAAVLALAAAAVVAGMKGYAAISGWVKDVPAPVLADLYMRAGARPAAAPSKATIWRVVTDADAEVFDAMVGS